MSENEKTSRPTKRMVLRRERVLVLPDTLSEGDVDKIMGGVVAAKVLRGAAAKTRDAWVPVGVFEGHSKTNSIEAHAGKPGTTDAKPGDYKAVPESAWSGGERYVKPAEPKVEREALT